LTISELSEELKQLKIPESWYYLHGLYGSTDDNDKIALLIMQEHCEVYYKERGNKTTDLHFRTEMEACKYVLKKMKTEMIFHKALTTQGIDGMTVNERLVASRLITDFDKAQIDDKGQAKLILRLLRVDEESINKIVK
jgi:hypothetical protein